MKIGVIWATKTSKGKFAYTVNTLIITWRYMIRQINNNKNKWKPSVDEYRYHAAIDTYTYKLKI